MADRRPAGTRGETTTVATWPPPPDEVVPSSQVMISRLSANAALVVMRGTKAWRKSSPWAVVPSCMSFLELGMISSKSAAVGLKPASGVIRAQRVDDAEISVKLIAGSCFRAYEPGSPTRSMPPLAELTVEHAAGRSWAYTRHE